MEKDLIHLFLVFDMNRKEVYLILKVIKLNKNLNSLTREGMSYKDIGLLLEYVLNEKLIDYVNEKMILTELGESKLSDDSVFFKKTIKDNWIERDFANQIKKIGVNDIYLPSKDSFSF